MFDQTNTMQANRLITDLARLATRYNELLDDLDDVSSAIINMGVVPALTANVLGAAGARTAGVVEVIGALAQVKAALDAVSAENRGKIVAYLQDYGVRPFTR